MRDLFKDYAIGPNLTHLIVGKGPSFRRIDLYENSHYHTIALNHAIRERDSQQFVKGKAVYHVGHIIDIDVLDQLGEDLLNNIRALWMPYYPHLGYRPHAFLTLEELCRTHPILSKMSDRVYGYNLSTASIMLNKKWNDSEIVWAKFFSAEAVVNILAKGGVKEIRTLGVDGGKGQASQFADLQNINTGGYDAEWKGIRKSIQKFQLAYSPLDTECPIRIFIGAGTQQLIPALVLKHSILKHATMTVDVTIMNEWEHPMPKDPRNQPRTPFSFQRFMIPEKCGYKGHAIYMDSDMLVFGDVKEIWQAEPRDVEVLVMRDDDVDKHKAKYSVMRLNCDTRGLRLWNINTIVDYLDKGITNYERLVFDLQPIAGRHLQRDGWNPDWNSLEEYTEGKTKLLHYTEMYNQPWLVNPNHSLGYLWFNELKELVNEEPSVLNLLEEHVKKGWLRKECLELISCGSTQPLLQL